MGSESLTDSLRETLVLFDGTGAPRTTSEVAEHLDLGRRSTYERLDRLVEHGRLRTKKVGASARVWWRPPAGGEGAVAAEAGASAGDGAADDADGAAASGPDVPSVVENLPVMVYRCRNEPGWPMEYVSDACADVAGHDASAVESGAVVWGEDVVHPDDRERVWQAVQSGVDGDGQFTVQYRVRTAGDETRWVWERGHVAREPSGSPAVLEGVITDITGQKATEDTLREQRERFRSLVDAVEEYAIFTLDTDGHVQTWNDGARRIKGYDREEILGRHFSTFYTEANREAGVPEENLAAAAADGSTQDEGWRVRADGTRFWAHVTITAIRDDDGDLEGFAKVTRDMTDRRERERAVREERNLLRSVLETSPTGIAIFDADGRARRVNRRFADLLGLDDEAAGEYVLGDRPARDDSGEEIPPSELPARKSLATGERVERRLQVEGGDGTRWLSVTAEPLDDGDGVVVATTDVTPLKERTRRLERRREDLESELEEVFERVGDGFYALDEQFRFTYVNERAEGLLDASEGELLGESVWDAFPEARDAPAWEAFHEAMETQQQTGYEVYYDPLGFWVEASVYPSESGLSVYFRDVTERKERENQLERYAGILEAIGEPAYELDETGRFTFVNDAFVEYSGYEESELLGRHVSLGMDEEAIERVEAMMPELLAEGGAGTATLQHEVVTEGGERSPVETRFSLLTDDEGRHQGTAGILLDVSERKARRRELERYETIVETIDEGVYIVDEAGRFDWVNRAYAEMVGYDPEELVGEHVSLVVDEETVRAAVEYEAALRDGEEGVGVIEAELQTADEGTVPAAGTFAMLPGDGGADRRVGVARDVTERKQYEEALTALHDSSRALLRAESATDVDGVVVDAVTDVLDLDGIVVYRYDKERDVLFPAARTDEGASVREELPVVPPDDSSLVGHQYTTGESRLFEDVHESPYLQTDATERHAGMFAPIGDHGIVVVASREVGAFDDRTARLVELLAANAEAAYDRVEREQERERRVRQQEVITELGQYALRNPDLGDLFDRAVEQVADTLDNAYAKVLELQPDGEELALRAGVGWRDGLVGEATVSTGRDSQAGYTLVSEEPVVVEEMAAEERFSGPELLTSHGVESGLSVVVGSSDDPWGVLGTHDTDRRTFAEHDANFVQSVAAILATAIERTDRERELERYETIVESIDEGVYVVDGDWRFEWVNRAYAAMTGYEPEELVGEHVSTVVDGDVVAAAREYDAALRDGEEGVGVIEAELQTADGGSFPAAASFALLEGNDGERRRVGVVRDVTERTERERALEESERRYRTLVDHFPNGAVVLFDEDLRYLTVGGEIYDGLEFSAEDLEGETMAEWLPQELFEDIAPAYRAVFDGEGREFEVTFDGEVRQFRVLPVYDEDGAVFAGMAVTQDVTRRREREAELERQREQLAALNNVNEVVRDITDAVIDQSTREEIERTVCERLAATDSYLFAWVGDVDVAADEVSLRTEAGVEGYLEEATISLDPDDEHGGGPTARAARTGEMQTTRDVSVDPDYEPWRDHAEEHGFRSSAAIPIVHGETVYGVLNVYADRPDAFEGQERAVVGQLGEVVGHAIAAAERKRALMSDEVVALEFGIQGLFGALDIDGAGEGTFSLDHAVPVDDGEFLLYGTADGEGVVTMETLVEEVPHWTDVTFRGDDADGDGGGDGPTDFELRLTEPPVLSRIASVGGSVEEAVLDDGDFRLLLHLAPGADARRIIDAVEEAYPAAEMVKRRQIARREGPSESLGRVVGAELTDRQRVALEAAYRGGFFEWPREVSGEEVAESLGVSPPTFHQHLRKAERKVLESVLSTPATAT